MKVIFLGTGTSSGIPVIACDCAVCTSADPRNRRRRTSLYAEAAGTRLVVDTPPDFREQALAYRIPRVDALLVTHAHADHVLGMDDIRRYNTIQKSAIPVYSSPETAVELRRIFGYVFRRDLPPGTYRPDLRFMEVEGPFQAGEVRITPLPVEHADAGTLGFRLEAEGRTLGYVPDCKRMADEVVARLAGVDVMILDALRHRPHSTHLTVADSVALLQRIRAKRSFLIHMCHDLDHDATQRGLPAGIEVSWDGLWLEW